MFKESKKDSNTLIQLILMTIICTTVLYFHSFHNKEGHKNVNKHVCSLQIMQLLAFQSPSLSNGLKFSLIENHFFVIFNVL